ncbi:hypothetical protein CPL00363_CDS0158 [Klebsiella phage Torridgeon]
MLKSSVGRGQTILVSAFPFGVVGAMLPPPDT